MTKKVDGFYVSLVGLVFYRQAALSLIRQICLDLDLPVTQRAMPPVIKTFEHHELFKYAQKPLLRNDNS